VATEEKLADTLEQITAQHGDQDGTRRKHAEKARQYAVYEREEAVRLRFKRDVIPPGPGCRETFVHEMTRRAAR
jgi:hypothetical protein